MGVTGWVSNSTEGVLVEAEGEKDLLDQFVTRLAKEKPPHAFIQGMETSYLDPVGHEKFEIRVSKPGHERPAFVLPDIATCPECLGDIFDKGNRRFLYPFTNCTNCGPRFSIIKSLPYDRANTTMQGFEMCDECRKEYEDPGNRRFHAQPNACPKCGPHVELWDMEGVPLSIGRDAVLDTANAIRNGDIVALKGIGGFQFLVDARNDESVNLLRSRKHREEKPFALMYPSLDDLRNDCEVSEKEERLLLSPEAPIVLLERKNGALRGRGQEVAPSVAPRNPYLGAMLPYSPLHHILMREIGFPVVATSGNISDEPICTDEYEALIKLAKIADVFLVHDRPIDRHVDDSVARIMMGRVQIVRRARGYAPFPVELDRSLGSSETEEILAVGGHLKNTIAMNSGNNVFISQHIGDLSTQESSRAFEKVTNDFRKLYEVSPRTIAHDLHPDYLSSRFARKSGKEGSQVSLVGVQHHFAHVASCMAENMLSGEVLGVSWDGTGYGEDGTVWGGEFLKTDGASYERVASLRPFRLPGSSASIMEPRRTAIGLLYEIFGEELFQMRNLEPVKAFDGRSLSVVKRMLETGLNSPLTTSVGRLFDAIGSILGLCQKANFEGQAAMELEFAIKETKSDERYGFKIMETKRQGSVEREYYRPTLIVDWEPILRSVLIDKSNSIPTRLVAAKFHNTLAELVVQLAERVANQRVALSGGCFQNKYLTERVVTELTRKGFRPYWHQRVPPNDGGISLGQIFVALQRNKVRSPKRGNGS
jgi:hydrogenase maturation protein HypF